MKIRLADGRQFFFNSRKDFEVAYFRMIYLRWSATGEIDGKKVFDLRKGTEKSSERKNLFKADPKKFAPVPPEIAIGLIGNFISESISFTNFAKLMGMHRTTLNYWFQTGVKHYHVWRSLLESCQLPRDTPMRPDLTPLDLDIFKGQPTSLL
ncbi:MAG: hypothetical protein HKM06_07685 [Spirochaetales bacterium]|nr:hypothetical protein [Spirochaetales bacterium]